MFAELTCQAERKDRNLRTIKYHFIDYALQIELDGKPAEKNKFLNFSIFVALIREKRSVPRSARLLNAVAEAITWAKLFVSHIRSTEH